jgi:hypothetical protein
MTHREIYFSQLLRKIPSLLFILASTGKRH